MDVDVLEGVVAEAATFDVKEGAGTAVVVVACTLGVEPVVETESVTLVVEDGVEEAVGITNAVVDLDLAGAALVSVVWEVLLERVLEIAGAATSESEVEVALSVA